MFESTATCNIGSYSGETAKGKNLWLFRIKNQIRVHFYIKSSFFYIDIFYTIVDIVENSIKY